MVLILVELSVKLDKLIHGLMLYIFTRLLYSQPFFSSENILQIKMHVGQTELLIACVC